MGWDRYFSFISAYQINCKHLLCILIYCHNLSSIFSNLILFFFLFKSYMSKRVQWLGWDTWPWPINQKYSLNTMIQKWTMCEKSPYGKLFFFFLLLQVVLSFLRHWWEISCQASSLVHSCSLFLEACVISLFLPPLLHLFSVSSLKWIVLFAIKNFNYTL